MSKRRDVKGHELIEVFDSSDDAFAVRGHLVSDEPIGHRTRPLRVWWAAIAGAAVVASAMLVVPWSSSREGGPLAAASTTSGVVVAAPSTNEVAVATRSPGMIAPSDGRCSDDRVPFSPAAVPDGWDTSTAVWSGVNPANGTGGLIEVAHGADLPTVVGATEPVAVLGASAELGAISDGYAVWFVLGAESDPCDHWALIAHPHTTPTTLQHFAEGLTTIDLGSRTLDCERTSPVNGDLPPDTMTVFGAVGLPTTALPTSRGVDRTGVSVLFAKAPLFIAVNSLISVSVAPEWRGILGLSWQSSLRDVTTLQVHACRGPTRWLLVYGGFSASRVGCMAVIINNGSGRQRVPIGIGAPCPGQAPPAQPSAV